MYQDGCCLQPTRCCCYTKARGDQISIAALVVVVDTEVCKHCGSRQAHQTRDCGDVVDLKMVVGHALCPIGI
jgi:hypothetical protein